MEQFIEVFRHLYGIKPVKQLADEAHSTPSALYRWGQEKQLRVES